MVLSMAVLCVFMLTMAAYGQVQLVDGFEAEQPFSAEESFRYAVASTDWASQGERSVRAVHRVIAEPQKGFLKKLGEVNWQNCDFFQIDFYNPHDVPVELAMYVMVGSDWDWNETTTVVADPGENLGVTFELKEDIWKNAATNWEHATAPDLSQIVGYGIIVYPTEEGIPEGSVYFDNFRLGTRDAKAAASPVVTATASLSSPIAFRPGDWKIGVGDGKLSFENGTVHITDYKGWKLLQMGANTTGAVDLRGYTGVQFEAKTSEATTIEFAIQLKDWAFQVVHRQEIAPEDGWVTMNVDLTGYDLSVVNALCIQQGAPADFSLRNIFPTPMPERAVAYDAESASIVSSPIKLSGTIDLELTARRVEVVKSVSPIGLNADDWKLQEGVEANLEFGENSLHVTDYPGWKRIERKKQIDLSDYTGIQFEVKVAAHTNFQFIMQPANWAWTPLFVQDIAPEEGWRTIKVDLSGHDLVGVNALIFQAGAVEFWIRNLMPIPLEAESEHYMEVEHDYGVELKLDYRISDDWTASMISTLAQESLEIGLVEVKGTARNLGIRAFANGTGVNLGDPMGVIKGEKYHKDKTAGLDLRSPLHTGFAHVLLSIPTKDRTGALLAGEVEIPVDDETVVQVLAAREWPTVGPDPEENLEKPVDSVVSAVVNTVLDNGLKLTGQVAISGHDGLNQS